jgi:AcrR family transcriptional regulator
MAAERSNRAQRAEQLLDIALRLIAEHGYEQATMAAIARGAGVTKPVIYRVYPSRQALLLALYRREQRRIDAALNRIVPRDPGDRSPIEVLRDGLTGILSAAAEHPLTWRLALFPSEGTPVAFRAIVKRRRAGFIRRARALVEWGIPYLDVETPPDPEILALMLVTWAEEHARLLLEDPSASVDGLTASATALLSAIAWRDPPQPASATSTAASASSGHDAESGADPISA